jgi:pyruvate/2-oxoglutarate dehydrogenase complex dihydrolipoamide acyltransferase (E2) component
MIAERRFVTDFTLPELGENISSGDVLRVLVKPGDTIQKEQSVLELETDKATIEVPSSVAGQVKEVKVKAGDKVKVGQVILSVEDGAGAKPTGAKEASAKSAEAAPARAGGEGGKADGRATAADAAPAPQPAKEKIPDVQPDIQATNQSTTPDKAGVKDPSVGPQAQSGAVDGDAPSRGKNVVDISRGARAPEPAATAAEGFVGTGCWRQARFIEPPFCQCCGLPYEGDLTTRFECGNCREMELYFHSARAAVVTARSARLVPRPC